MTIDAQTVLAIVLALIAGVVWLVRLEAKINRAEEREKDQRLRVDERHNELRGDFYRLRNRIEAGKVYVFRKPTGPDSDEGVDG